MKRIIPVSLLVLFFAFPCFAENSFLDALGLGQKVSPLAKLEKTRDDIMKNYLGSSQDLAGSLSKLGQVFGVQPVVSQKLAGVASLNPQAVGASDLTQIRQNLEFSVGAIKQAMQSPQKLSPENVQLFVTTLTGLSDNWKKMKSLMPQAKSLVDQTKTILNTAPLQDKMKLQGILSPGLGLLQNIPAQLMLHKDLVSNLLSFASTNNITVPAQAKKALSLY